MISAQETLSPDIESLFWNCTSQEYHADHTTIGASMMEQFRDSRLDYRSLFVTHTKHPDDPSDALRLGSAVHCMMLEPELYDSSVVVFSETKTLKSKAGAEFVLLNPGKIILTEEQSSYVVPMVKSLLSHPKVKEIMGMKLWCEKGLKAVHTRFGEPTGLTLKCRPDLLNRHFQVNIKTSRHKDPASWARDAANLGYHRGGAHYQDVIHRALGWRVKTVFFVVQNEPDYEPACYFLEDDDIELGREQNERTLYELAQCYKTGEWRALQNREIMRVPLPRYARYEE